MATGDRSDKWISDCQALEVRTRNRRNSLPRFHLLCTFMKEHGNVPDGDRQAMRDDMGEFFTMLFESEDGAFCRVRIPRAMAALTDAQGNLKWGLTELEAEAKRHLARFPNATMMTFRPEVDHRTSVVIDEVIK